MLSPWLKQKHQVDWNYTSLTDKVIKIISLTPFFFLLLCLANQRKGKRVWTVDLFHEIAAKRDSIVK